MNVKFAKQYMVTGNTYWYFCQIKFRGNFFRPTSLKSMEHSRFREAKMSSASQEIFPILWNPKVHCHNHKSPLPLPILRQINPVHASQSHFLKSTLILSSHLIFSSKWSLSLKPPHQNPVRASSVSHTCHMPLHLILLGFLLVYCFRVRFECFHTYLNYRRAGIIQKPMAIFFF